MAVCGHHSRTPGELITSTVPKHFKSRPCRDHAEGDDVPEYPVIVAPTHADSGRRRRAQRKPDRRSVWGGGGGADHGVLWGVAGK